MAKLKRYTILTPVEHVTGHQEWTVMASSPEEAKSKQDEWEYVGEELDIQSLGEPEIIEEE